MASQPKSGYGCCGIIGIGFLIFLGLGLIMKAVEGIKNISWVSAPQSAKTDQISSPKSELPKEPPPKSKTPAEYLKEAKSELAKKSNVSPYGEIYQAAYLLNEIPKDAPEYHEAQKLLNRIEHLKEKDTAAIRLREAKEQRAKRLIYGPGLENLFLDKGYDITVKITGKDATTLRIKWILTSRVLVHQISKDQNLIQSWRQLGFKKVIFTDGYRSNWEMTL